MDFRALIKVIMFDKYPIPTINELIDELHGSQIFSEIDLKTGLHQIQMQDADVHMKGTTNTLLCLLG